MLLAGQFAHRAVEAFEGQREHRAADEKRTLLINELNHRVKNTLATVQSIVAQTLRVTQSSVEARAAHLDWLAEVFAAWLPTSHSARPFAAKTQESLVGENWTPSHLASWARWTA